MPQTRIKQVQQKYTRQWLAMDGVEGTALGFYEGKPCIKILTSVKAQKLRTQIPATIEGYPVIIEETGIFRALNQPQ